MKEAEMTRSDFIIKRRKFELGDLSEQEKEEFIEEACQRLKQMYDLVGSLKLSVKPNDPLYRLVSKMEPNSR